MMKQKIILSMLCLLLLVFVLSGVSYGWQGRMGGAGDPYGLLSDESDLLVNPAGIAQGEGIKFYSHYRFTYTDVTSWNFNLDQILLTGLLFNVFDYDTSGQEYSHNALLGAATPLGSGRFGIFFTYDGMRGDYEGDENILAMSNFAEYELMSDLDNFAVRLMYGLPVGGMDTGFELGMAYRDEMQNTWILGPTFYIQNNINSFGAAPYTDLLPFMIPYDSHYWELLWKAGMEKALGPLGVNASVRGGYIISSDNNYQAPFQSPVGTTLYNVDMEGDVAGWRIGSDIWVRVPGGSGMTLPFLFSIDYAEKKRDGDGVATGLLDTGLIYDYTHKEQSLDLKAGGGITKELGGTMLVAAGLYYNYLQGSDDVSFSRSDLYTSDNSEMPSYMEHRVIVKLTGEVELSPAVTLRMGLEPFYGWVREDFAFDLTNPALLFSDDISLAGYRWGIGGSLGGSVSFDSFTMEPFFNVGWQQFSLEGDGADARAGGVIANLWGMGLSRDEWYIGGGCSFLYDMP